MTPLPHELEQSLLDDAFVDRLADAIAPRLAVRLAELPPAPQSSPAPAVDVDQLQVPGPEVGNVAERPAAAADTTLRLVNAGELAELLGVSRSTVYEHADELGALKVGNGQRPRLRFDPQRALAAWGARSTSDQSQAADRTAAQGDQLRRPPRRAGRTPPRLPEPGSVPALKPHSARADRLPPTGAVLAVKPRSR